MTTVHSLHYRLRSPVVEAMRVPTEKDSDDRDFMAWARLAFWLGKGDWTITEGLGVDVPVQYGMAHVRAKPGDWIVRMPDGFRVCKAKEFAATFEAVDV